MTSFTQEAELWFQASNSKATEALDADKEMDKLDGIAGALVDLSNGLNKLSKGLRATYIKIEQLESKQFRDPRRGFNG